MNLTPEDVEAIERATLAAVAPLELIEDDGWLLAANEGVISRANSASALTAGSDPLDAKIERATAFYETRGLPPMFRLSPWSRPDPVAQALSAHGFSGRDPVLVMVARVADVIGEIHEGIAGSVSDRPHEAWRDLFLGPDVGAAEADKRIAALARGEGMRFASVLDGEKVIAVGVCSIAGAWASIHGMRSQLTGAGATRAVSFAP